MFLSLVSLIWLKEVLGSLAGTCTDILWPPRLHVYGILALSPMPNAGDKLEQEGKESHKQGWTVKPDGGHLHCICGASEGGPRGACFLRNSGVWDSGCVCKYLLYFANIMSRAQVMANQHSYKAGSLEQLGQPPSPPPSFSLLLLDTLSFLLPWSVSSKLSTPFLTISHISLSLSWEVFQSPNSAGVWLTYPQFIRRHFPTCWWNICWSS